MDETPARKEGVRQYAAAVRKCVASVSQYIASVSQYILVAGVALAFWPVWMWYVSRTLDRSDEPWGLLALTTVLIFLFLGKRNSGQTNHQSNQLVQLALIVSLSLYIVTFTVAPNLVQSILLVWFIWLILISRLAVPSRASVLGLLLLALPVVPSLNFYAGYPLRYIVAAGSAFLLNCLCIPVVQEGTMLSIKHQLVAIDAPCSGISMLWVEAYAAMLIASIFKLDARKTAGLSACVLLLILTGNILRASTLVLFDQLQSLRFAVSYSQLEPTVHVVVGLMIFCLITVITYSLAKWLSAMPVKPRHERGLSVPLKASAVTWLPQISWQISSPLSFSFANKYKRFINACTMLLCLVCALVPFLAHASGSAVTPAVSPTWPSQINGAPVTTVQLFSEEKAFAADFPGQMKRFTDGTSAYFMRYVTNPTRQLHPSSDCFKGLGYSVAPGPLLVGGDGARWSSFQASKEGGAYLVMERIYDQSGHSWSDVSAWYWSAALGKSKGPWFDATIAKPLHY